MLVLGKRQVRLGAEVCKRMVPHDAAIMQGPKGGRYIQLRSGKKWYVGDAQPGAERGGNEKPEGSEYGRWAAHVRVRGGRDARLPEAGTELTRHFRGREVKVVESDGQFHVHIDGEHSASARSLTGALSRALGRGVSGYAFMRLGSAHDDADALKRDWKGIGAAREKLGEHVRGQYGKDAKVVVEHRRDGGVRAHVHVGEGDKAEHHIVEGDEKGAAGQVYEEKGGKWVKREAARRGSGRGTDASYPFDDKGNAIPLPDDPKERSRLVDAQLSWITHADSGAKRREMLDKFGYTVLSESHQSNTRGTKDVTHTVVDPMGRTWVMATHPAPKGPGGQMGAAGTTLVHAANAGRYAGPLMLASDGHEYRVGDQAAATTGGRRVEGEIVRHVADRDADTDHAILRDAKGAEHRVRSRDLEAAAAPAAARDAAAMAEDERTFQERIDAASRGTPKEPRHFQVPWSATMGGGDETKNAVLDALDEKFRQAGLHVKTFTREGNPSIGFSHYAPEDLKQAARKIVAEHFKDQPGASPKPAAGKGAGGGGEIPRDDSGKPMAHRMDRDEYVQARMADFPKQMGDKKDASPAALKAQLRAMANEFDRRHREAGIDHRNLPNQAAAALGFASIGSSRGASRLDSMSPDDLRHAMHEVWHGTRALHEAEHAQATNERLKVGRPVDDKALAFYQRKGATSAAWPHLKAKVEGSTPKPPEAGAGGGSTIPDAARDELHAEARRHVGWSEQIGGSGRVALADDPVTKEMYWRKSRVYADIAAGKDPEKVRAEHTEKAKETVRAFNSAQAERQAAWNRGGGGRQGGVSGSGPGAHYGEDRVGPQIDAAIEGAKKILAKHAGGAGGVLIPDERLGGHVLDLSKSPVKAPDWMPNVKAPVRHAPGDQVDPMTGQYPLRSLMPHETEAHAWATSVVPNLISYSSPLSSDRSKRTLHYTNPRTEKLADAAHRARNTNAENVTRRTFESALAEDRAEAMGLHRKHVEAAAARGEHVPASVLMGYPDLHAKAPKAAARDLQHVGSTSGGIHAYKHKSGDLYLGKSPDSAVREGGDGPGVRFHLGIRDVEAAQPPATAPTPARPGSVDGEYQEIGAYGSGPKAGQKLYKHTASGDLYSGHNPTSARWESTDGDHRRRALRDLDGVKFHAGHDSPLPATPKGPDGAHPGMYPNVDAIADKKAREAKVREYTDGLHEHLRTSGALSMPKGDAYRNPHIFTEGATTKSSPHPFTLHIEPQANMLRLDYEPGGNAGTRTAGELPMKEIGRVSDWIKERKTETLAALAHSRTKAGKAERKRTEEAEKQRKVDEKAATAARKTALTDLRSKVESGEAPIGRDDMAHLDRVHKLVSAAQSHAKTLAPYGVRDAEVHVHPDAVRLVGQDGAEYARFAHDESAPERHDRVAPHLRDTLPPGVAVHDEAAPTSARKSLASDWTLRDDGDAILSRAPFPGEPVAIPAGFAGVLYQPGERVWVAVRGVEA